VFIVELQPEEMYNCSHKIEA